MARLDDPPYERHIFVCIKDRADGRDCCKSLGALELVKKLRTAVAKAGLHGRIRINKSQCLDRCNPVGPSVVVYPEGVWYDESTPADHDEIVEKWCSSLP